MWKSFPIQTSSDRGDECATIQRGFKYTKYEDVEISEWKSVPANVKQWCLSLWKEHFGTQRDPNSDSDLVGWIPSKGVIVAKYGRWIGNTRSRNAVYVDHLYVSPLNRGERLAEHLIHSICYESCARWGDSLAFLFEVDSIPQSLTDRGAQPLCRYHYTWILFTSIEKPPKWKPCSLDILKTKKGFHAGFGGWKAYTDGENYIVFDSSNDIVWYSSATVLHTFDGFTIVGAYCRIFSPLGSSAVFAENMYFDPSAMVHYVI